MTRRGVTGGSPVDSNATARASTIRARKTWAPQRDDPRTDPKTSGGTLLAILEARTPPRATAAPRLGYVEAEGIVSAASAMATAAVAESALLAEARRVASEVAAMLDGLGIGPGCERWGTHWRRRRGWVLLHPALSESRRVRIARAAPHPGWRLLHAALSESRRARIAGLAPPPATRPQLLASAPRAPSMLAADPAAI